MKFCSNCNQPLEDDAYYCYKCGTIFSNEQQDNSIYEQQMKPIEVRFCSTCGADIKNTNSQYCSHCGAKIEAVPSAQSNVPVYEQSVQSQYTNIVTPIVQHPMNWFKFLIYFALFFGAFINFVFGFNYITGGIYFAQSNGQVTAAMVYAMYGDGLKVLDVIQGIFMIGIAAFGVYTRFRLAKYKANAPLCLYILYGVGIGVSLFYNVILLAVTGINQLVSVSSIVSIVSTVVFILLNYTYFTKRKDLFVN